MYWQCSHEVIMLIAAKESVANRRRAADILSELWLGVRMTLEEWCFFMAFLVRILS